MEISIINDYELCKSQYQVLSMQKIDYWAKQKKTDKAWAGTSNSNPDGQL